MLHERDGAHNVHVHWAYRNMADFGLMFYNARWYDPAIGRFAQADSIVPDAHNPQDWNRYSYALDNPVLYSDPSGHDYCDRLNNNNYEDCTAGEQRIASKTRREIPSWDQTRIGGVTPADVSRAELAYIHFATNPGYFESKYVDPAAWIDDPEVAALDIFAGYSVLGLTAEQLVRLAVTPDQGDVLDRARLANWSQPGAITATSVNGTVTLAGAIALIYDSTLKYKTDLFHNFPTSMDEMIITDGTITLRGGNMTMATMPGRFTTAGRTYEGQYEIGWYMNPDGSYQIIHRQFRPSGAAINGNK